MYIYIYVYIYICWCEITKTSSYLHMLLLQSHADISASSVAAKARQMPSDDEAKKPPQQKDFNGDQLGFDKQWTDQARGLNRLFSGQKHGIHPVQS